MLRTADADANPVLVTGADATIPAFGSLSFFAAVAVSADAVVTDADADPTTAVCGSSCFSSSAATETADVDADIT